MISVRRRRRPPARRWRPRPSSCRPPLAGEQDDPHRGPA
jgi:hypothetical protein